MSSLRPRWDDARFAFAAEATGTDVMIGAMLVPAREEASGSASVVLHVHGGALVDDVAPALARELEAIARPSSALVLYAPSGSLPAYARAAGPLVVESVRSRLGASELVLLPLGADELVSTRDLDARVAEAVGRTSAPIVALAGMLPSLVGLGLRDVGDLEGRVVTTGHAATVAAMVLTVRRALRELGREFSRAHVAALGFGSIGRATWALCRALLGEPASFRVVDPSPSLAGTHAWERAGDVRGCDLVIAASSGGATLDVDALAPGTLVVDDSFPRAFSDERAWARMRGSRDVVLVGGGMLDVGPLVRRSPFAEADSVRRTLPVRWLPGCHAEACVLALRPALGPTRGLVDVERALAMLEALDELDVHEAPLHLGPAEIPRDVISGAAAATPAAAHSSRRTAP